MLSVLPSGSGAVSMWMVVPPEDDSCGAGWYGCPGSLQAEAGRKKKHYYYVNNLCIDICMCNVYRYKPALSLISSEITFYHILILNIINN